ncbi:MAG: penicillin-binding protein 2, partial [Bacteroidales bacterium]|nr:penicillin-binding protein 2 [Bacteroidales bacterium]
SVFICFAPKNNPQIAVAVYIENAQGGGGTWAAPIASLIVEKHIRGTVEREEMEKYYIETNPCQPLPLKRKIKTKKK